MKLTWWPRAPTTATKSWKPPKWPEYDQFRTFHFSIKRFYGLEYSLIDVELQGGFFEIFYRFVVRLVLELLTKNVSKNLSTKFRHGHGSRKLHCRWRLGIEIFISLFCVCNMLCLYVFSVCWHGELNNEIFGYVGNTLLSPQMRVTLNLFANIQVS